MKKLFIIFAMLMGVSACNVPLKPILCGSDSTIIFPKGEIVFRFGSSQPCAKRKVRIKMEVSNLNYIYWRDTAKCRAYFRQVFKVVQDIYKNDPAGITLELAGIKVWDTPDPYTAYTTGSTVLYNFAITEFAKPEQLTYDLAIYVDRQNGANNKASYAYPGGLNPGYYAQKYLYVCIPIENAAIQPYPAYNYSSKTIAHELYHSFGNKHTHWCGNKRDDGTIGVLDSAWQPEAISGQPACKVIRKTTTNGTIGSYADLVYNGGVNLSRGLGFKYPREAALMTLASCTSCPCDNTNPPLPCTYTYGPWESCRPNGSQRRPLLNASPIGCIGIPDTVKSCAYVPPLPPVQDGVIGPVMHYVQNQTSFFRFNIPSTGNWLYEVAYCRYDGAMNPPDSVTPPAACGIRNALNFSRPSSVQLSNGLINLQAISQPAERNKWYRVRVRYRNGSTSPIMTKQSAWFWW